MTWGFMYNNTPTIDRYMMHQQYGYAPYFGGGYRQDSVQDINFQIVQSIRLLSQNLRAGKSEQVTSSDWLGYYQQHFNINFHNKPQVRWDRPAEKPKTTKTLSVDFVNRVKEIALKVKCDYRDLLGVMNNESGLNPKARNKDSGAIGLIQFTTVAIKDLNKAYGLNLTKEKIAKMSAMEQLDLVEKYLIRTKSFKFKSNDKLSSADLYAIVYRPAFAGKKVIASQGDGATYNLNKGLDVNKDGVITNEDLALVVQRKRINVNLVA